MRSEALDAIEQRKALEVIRIESTGKLPAYAWPGGYPIMYLCADNGSLCPACANGENGSEAAGVDLDLECPDDLQWIITAWYIHYEGPPAYCDHCNSETESAYGDPDSEED